MYLGKDPALGREVAIKVPFSRRMTSPEEVDAFLSEARMLAQLDHPGIVPVYDFGRTDDGLCYLVSKYIRGGSLAVRLRSGRFAHREAAGLVASVAEALHHAHQRGLVHRDIKPANILLESDGRPVVADFGLALREEDFGRGPTRAGTPAYMSPEQARGEGHLVDARTDIYSLGVVLYVLLTGQRPFQGRDREELLEFIKRREARPPRQLDDTVPRELDRICLRALGKRASDRYSTAADFAEDLRQWLAGQPAGRPSPEQEAGPTLLGGAAQPSASVRVPTVSSASELSNEPLIPRGLRSFDAEDADFFLSLLPGPRGRGGLPESVRFWKALLEETDGDRTFRVGLLYGPSGCGKSSLVKAGLLPRLAGHVTAVYVEATADDTEAGLLRALRKRWAGLPEGLSLAEALARLRRGEGPAAGRKVVVVFDQFEQWLHAHTGPEREGLVEALRQCDGARVQALLLVRDDFWMGISRFMRELEVPLREGQNSAAVDLFDVRHARKVLAAFGRAFGALPSQAASEGAPAGPEALTGEQRRFLDRAVAGLAEGGKVIPVRLALFAEMVKGKPWTPATWKEMGGAEGVGVAFLEETFGSPTAPPQHRVHEKAARAVLKRLLPEPGLDLRGPMRSRQELLEASGYARHPQQFDELLAILDGELRLVTATDRESPEASAGDGRSYQLTHDYLVPALREWLTRKRKETARGRAELRMEERAALWDRKPEDRYLPSWWEWARIRLFTRPRDWTPGQRKMMRRAGRYHALRAAALVLILALAGWGVREYLGGLKAEALRDQLLSAETADVPGVVADTAAYSRWLDPLLRTSLARAEADGEAKRELHLRLALLRTDPGEVEPLYERMLAADAAEFRVIRGELAPHREGLTERLWAELADRDGDPDRRFRAACALAAYAPEDARWEEFAGLVAAQLVTKNPLVLDDWKEALQPAGRHLLPSLAGLLEEGQGGVRQRRTVAELYRAFAGGRQGAFAPLESRLAEGQAAGSKTESARRRANIASALAAMGRGEEVWPLLRHSPDPTVRSWLIERLGPGMIDPGALEARIGPKTEVSVRRALILALGAFDTERPPSAVRKLRRLYEEDPDPGVHAACGWVLRRWGQDEALGEIDRRLATGRPEGGRGWYVNREGQTFVIVLLPGEGEGRRYAIAGREVTVAEFRRWKSGHMHDVATAPSGDCPVNKMTWAEAAAYCNWLSLRDGIPKEQWCYEETAGGMRPAADLQQRAGYRLPTEAEWEFAARAGAVTACSCGDADDELLGKYAWYDYNAYPAGMRCARVGSLKPNDLGLFDMLGNVREWCQDAAPVAEDAKEGGEEGPTIRMTRGGSLYDRIQYVRCDMRLPFAASQRSSSQGFRPARTLP